jgi:hypothetical protein
MQLNKLYSYKSFYTNNFLNFWLQFNRSKASKNIIN